MTVAEDLLALTLTITDSRLDEDEREGMARQLIEELRGSELGEVGRPRGEAPPPGAKSWIAEATGVLSVLIGAAGLRPLFDYLIERYRGHEISVELEVQGQKVKIVARSQEDLVLAHNAAANLLNGRR